ncbi:MAG TPA: ATP-dependent protease subunit HslV [bacterium]|nr:ATP-dependent protease subunit HslV [bacterium]
MHGTTVIAVKKKGVVAMAGDGQITQGDMIIKSTARKIRKLYNDTTLAGFAGSTADAITLFEKFEKYLEKYEGNIKRSAVELTKEWRTDRILRRLEAMLIVANKDTILLLSGNGDVVEPDDDVGAIGSGSGYALAAATALLKHTNLSAEEIVKESLSIAANRCIFTNENIIIEKIEK